MRRALILLLLTVGMLSSSRLIAHAAIPLAASNHADFALGYLHCELYPGVNNAGGGSATTNTTQINICLQDAFNNNLAAWFPCGTYNINGMLFVYEWNNWQTSNNQMQTPDQRSVVIRGSRVGCTKPVIKLAASSSGFTDSANPRPMLHIRGFDSDNANAVANAQPSEWDETPANMTGTGRHLFEDFINNIEFDTNANAGAICLSWGTGQMSAVEDVKCTATSSWGGIYSIPGQGGYMVNFEVIGGQHCIVSGELYGLKLKLATGSMVIGAKCTGQTGIAIDIEDQSPTIFTGLEITKSATGTPFAARGPMMIQDAKVTLSGSAANILVFDNPSGWSFYLRNVYVSGSTNLVKNKTDATFTGSGTWVRLQEYMYVNQFAKDGNSDPTFFPSYTSGNFQFEERTYINGALAQNKLPVSQKVDNSPAPPNDLITRHAWTTIPTFEDGPFENPDDYGDCNATLVATGRNTNSESGNTGPDCSQELQTAIDNAQTAGHNRVHLPRGVIALGSQFTLHPNTKLMAAAPIPGTGLVYKTTWLPTSQTYLLRTDNSASGSAYMGFISTYTRSLPFANQFIGRFLWRVGKDSMTHAMAYHNEWKDPRLASQNTKDIQFNMNGGGRHYGHHNFNKQADSNPGWRHIYVNGTTQPLTLYGQNVESTKESATPADDSIANIEVTNSANVRIYGCKREGQSPTIIIQDSQNIALYGCGAMTSPLQSNQTAWVSILGSSADVLTALHVVRNIQTSATPANQRPMLKEQIPGFLNFAGIPWPNGLAYYQRGKFIDDPFENGTPTVNAPVFLSATVNTANRLDVCWQTFDTAAMIPSTLATGFTVTVDAVSKTPTSVVRNGNTCYFLTFASSTITTGSQVVVVSYAPGNISSGGSGTPLVTPFSNQTATNNLPPASSPVLTQTAFAFRSLHGDLDSTDWYQQSGNFENINPFFILGAAFRLHLKVANTVASAPPQTYSLCYEKNESGTYALVPDTCTASDTCFTNAPDVGDREPTTEMLTPTQATFVPGVFREQATGEAPVALTTNTETGLEYSILINTTAAVGDRYRYRVCTSAGTALSAYTVTPLVTTIAPRENQRGGGTFK